MLPSINFLKREQENKLTEKNKTYKIILERCGRKIKDVNKSTNRTFTSFEVPKYILGFGEYNYKDCIKYIMENLINEGYNAEYFEPNHIYIDWGNASKNIGESQKKIHYPKWIEKEKLLKQTEKLLKNYPNAQKVEFVFEE